MKPKKQLGLIFHVGPYALYVTNITSKLSSHQQDSQNFTKSTHTTAVNLAELETISLEKLLEDDSILAVFPCGNTYSVRFQCLGNCSMPC